MRNLGLWVVIACVGCSSSPGEGSGKDTTTKTDAAPAPGGYSPVNDGAIGLWVKACIRESACDAKSLSSCVQFLGRDDYWAESGVLVGLLGGSMTSWREVATEQAECAAAAATCEEYAKCKRPGGFAACDPASEVSQCKGNVAANCVGKEGEAGFLLESKCDALPGGGSCAMEDERATCVWSQCSKPPGCQGSLWLRCEHGEYGDLHWVVDCSLAGMTCDVERACVDVSAGSCTEDSCSGQYVLDCHDGNWSARNSGSTVGSTVRGRADFVRLCRVENIGNVSQPAPRREPGAVEEEPGGDLGKDVIVESDPSAPRADTVAAAEADTASSGGCTATPAAGSSGGGALLSLLLLVWFGLRTRRVT